MQNWATSVWQLLNHKLFRRKARTRCGLFVHGSQVLVRASTVVVFATFMRGALAEWLCSGLQIRGHRFDLVRASEFSTFRALFSHIFQIIWFSQRIGSKSFDYCYCYASFSASSSGWISHVACSGFFYACFWRFKPNLGVRKRRFQLVGEIMKNHSTPASLTKKLKKLWQGYWKQKCRYWNPD